MTIYFTEQPVPSVWEDINEYAYVGYALDNEMTITGLMLERFSKWLVVPGHSQRQLQPA